MQVLFRFSIVAAIRSAAIPRALRLIAATVVLLVSSEVSESAETSDGFPLTKAESSGYAATASFDEIWEFVRALDEKSDEAAVIEFGETVEGRKLPALILSRPGIGTAAAAKRSKRPVILCVGNIHGGEVCGKEALLMLAREIVSAPGHPFLEDFILVFVPILNADGNERFSTENRPGQDGPRDGMGRRENAAGLDLNRDFVKLEAPETRALVRLVDTWDPILVIDTHTTNGSRHRYALTYDGSRHPATDPRLLKFVHETFLPGVSRKFARNSDYEAAVYGNFANDHQQWVTFPALPRYSTHYFGLANRLSILSEAYAYAPYRDRVLATKEFVSACISQASAKKDRILDLLERARNRTVRLGERADGTVPIRAQAAPIEETIRIKGYRETEGDEEGSAREERDYTLEYWGTTEVTREVERPYAYLFPADLGDVVENLQRHGIEVEELREDIELDVEIYRITDVTRAVAPVQGRRVVSLDTSIEEAGRIVKSGTIVVRTGQELGRLAAYLLEPGSEDGLAAWSFFDGTIANGGTFPVQRVAKPVSLLTGKTRPLREERQTKRPVTFEVLFGEEKVDFRGDSARIGAWFEDGRSYLQVRNGALHRVDAMTGKSHRLFQPRKVARALSRLPEFGEKEAKAISERTRFTMTADHSGALLNHENDLYFFSFDGSIAVRLTHTPEEEELESFSPDGQFAAYVRGDNLFVVDLERQLERALTTDGGGAVRNGKADWVYFEEIYQRNWKAYWWSPDSRRVAFQRFDDSALPTFHALDTLPLHGKLESMRHPKAGDPNPHVRLGVVTVAGGPVRWIPLDRYSPDGLLISGAGWDANGESVYFYAQDRAQTWMDFNVWKTSTGETKNYFREKTEAWVEVPKGPRFLDDGSLLLTSERSGWRHLYRFTPSNGTWFQITSGEWEVRTLHQVHEPDGWVYFSGTRDSHIADHLYRCRLDGSDFERLSSGDGHHRVSLNPTATLFIDTHSDLSTPERVGLFQTDGSFVRTLQSNPVYPLEEFEWGESELFQIESGDGFQFEAAWTKPPNFSPDRRYPVWFMTYAGPHAQSVRNAWSSARTYDQMLARLGLVVFRMDPRSASGKGAGSTWTAYRRLGAQEMADITEAIEWLKDHPFIDGSRIGMSGHSYGGFMTAYALTHSRLFSAGIAGAPVTDFRYYDTIYTERYMDTPANNPEGYDAASVVKAAGNLHGRLLLLHGMVDDNVHLQNATALAHALQEAEKPFELMFYPAMKHGLHGRHYQRLIVDFIRDALELSAE